MYQPKGPQADVVNPRPLAISFHDSSNELQIEIIGHRRWYHRLLGAFPVLMFGAAFLVSVLSVTLPFIVFRNIGHHPGNLAPTDVIITSAIFVVLFVIFPFLMLRAAWRNFMTVLMQRELVSVNVVGWSTTREYGLWRGIRRFRATEISNFHQVFVDDRPSLRNLVHLLLDERGSISFRHKGSRVAIASGATEAEARLIVSAVLRRFPQLAGAPATPHQKPVRPSARSSWTADQTADALDFTIPVKPNWGIRLYLLWGLLFSAFWVGSFVVFADTEFSAGKFTLLFLVFLMIFMGAGLLTALWSLRELWWQFIGKEIVRISASGIRIQDTNLWLSRPRQLLGEHIYGLRYVPRTYRSEERVGWFRQPGKWGSLAFDYGAGTYRFGYNLSLAEADEALQLILNRFPKYGRQDVNSPSV